jgi:AsmA protein
MNAKRSPTRRVLRFVAFGLLNLVVLIVVVALVAPLFFDPNDYKDEIAEQVKARTGRDLSIVGDMSFSVLPWLGVSTGEIRLGNAPGFGDAPFATFDSADVRVKLMPLFSRDVQMDTIHVRGLELNLMRDASGNSNWDDLAAAGQPAPDAATGAAPGAAPDAAPAADGGPARGALAAFALGGVNIEDAQISYTDAVTGERISLTQVDLRTGEVALGEPVNASVSLRFAHPQGSGKASASARLNYDLANKRYGAQGLEFEGEMDAAALGTGTASARLRGDLIYDDAARVLSGRKLTMELNAPPLPGSGIASALALEADGDVDLRLAENAITSPALRVRVAGMAIADMQISAQLASAVAGTLDTMRFALEGMRAEAQVSGGRFGATALPLFVGGDVRLDLPAQSVQIDALQLEVADMKAGGELQLAGFSGTPAISGKLAAPAFALDALLARLGVAPPDTRDPKALASAAFSAGFASDGKQLSLKPLKLELDGATLDGSARAASSGALAFDLAVDRLDVDRYLPPAAKAAPPSAAGAIPVETIRGLDIDGRLRVGALRYAGLDLSKVTLGIKAKDSQLRLAPLQAELYGGRYDGDIRIDARGELPVMQLDEKLAKVDAAALLKALGVNTGVLDLAGGRSDLALKATVTGNANGQRVKASGVVLDGSIAGRSFKGGAVPIGLRGDVAVDLAARNAVLDKVQLRFAELSTAADLRIGYAPGALGYAGTVNVTPFNVRALAARLSIPMPTTADAKAFTAVGGKATLDGSASGVKANAVALALDGSAITGSLAIQNFAAPAIAFDVDVDRINVDRYLPPSAQGKAASPGAAVTALPVDLVRSLNLDGTLKVGALTVGGMKMSNVRLSASGKDGLLKMSPLAAALYGGRYEGNVTMDARAQVPRIALDETITGVQVGDLLKDATGKAPVLTGATDLRAVLGASGGDTQTIMRTLDGDVRFAIHNGTLEKVDMVNSMCTTLAALDFDNLNKKTIAAGVIGLIVNAQQAARATPGAAGTRTEFTEMSGSARLTKGVARNDDLVMSSPVVRARGAGTIDLPANRIDYRAEAELVQSCAGIGQRDLAGQVIPVNISGPIDNPSIRPEIPSGLIQALRKRQPAEQAPTSPQPAPPVEVVPGQVLPGQRVQPGQQQAQPAPEQPPPQQQAPPPPQKPKEALRGILEGILKQR